MLDIVVLSHRIPYPPNKGEKIRTYNQVKYLVDLGFRVRVLAPQETENDINHANGLQNVLGVSCELYETKPTWFKYVAGFFKGDAISVANFYAEPLASRLASLINSSSVHAVLCSSSAMAPYVFALKDLFLTQPVKPRLVMDFMDLDSDKWLQYSANSAQPMKWVYQRESSKIQKLEAEIVEFFDRSYFISSNEVDLFLKLNKGIKDIKKVGIVGNGLDTNVFYPTTNKVGTPEPVFLFTGVMDYKPNIDAVVWFVEHCWDALLKIYPHAEFIIAGMNPSREVSDLTKKPGITVTGFVDDILPYFHKSSVFVAPFRLARGVQNKILQAFACGVAVVTTPMGAEGIACEDGRHLILANTPADIIQAIVKLLADLDFKNNIEGQALALIHDTYSWAGQLKPLQEFLLKEGRNETSD